MPIPSTSPRVADTGATLRFARPAWVRRGPARGGRVGLWLLLGVAGLLAVVYLTLRLTPLSTVQRVTIVGVQGPDAARIRTAIERASIGQSTLGFGDGAVHRAVADTASITGVTVHAKFPHAVQVEVRQLRAVGAVAVGGRKIAVSSDGRLLPDWDVGELPVIRGAKAARGEVRGGGRLATSILGLAPAELLAHVARVDDGTVVRLAGGPALLFRDTNRLNAKWAAAVAVLGDPGTAGATWIDLRVPEAPVAGQGAPPSLPPRGARVGRVAGVSDALATAEQAASATGGPIPGEGAVDPSPAPAASTRAASVATGTATGTPDGAAPASAGAPTPAPAAAAATPTSGAAPVGTPSTGSTTVSGAGAAGASATTSTGGTTAPAGGTTP